MEDNRFHYPQSQGTRLPRPKYGAHRVDQFPPHPSVRLPPNVSRSGSNKVPAGVGVAPRPVKKTQAQLHPPPVQPLNPGHTIQNFKFPQVPPPIPADSRRRDLAPSSKGRYNMHDSYVSSIHDDSATPKTTPSSKSARFPTPPRESSIYPETEYYDSPQPAYPSSRIMPPSEFPTPSQSRGTDSNDEDPRRLPTIVTSNPRVSSRLKLGDISPASSRTTAMNALTAAIAAGISYQQQPSPDVSTPPARTFSPVRMPFEVSASRPRTPEAKEDLEPPQLRDPPSAGAPLQTPNSANSMNPLLGLGINNPGMSSKIPVTKRPPKLNIDAVRDMESRGSTTSLTDLIRRATRLASNLDRGKTASRLGMLDMFGSSEKLGHYPPANRDSTMSDLMSAFPAPGAGGTPQRDTHWPLGEKGYLVNQQEVPKKSPKTKRKCCGLSVPVFITVLIIVVVLIAAAVLLPIFLILVPRMQNHTFDFSTCPTAYPCENAGTSIVSNDACQCICVNGFVGAHCEMLGSSNECTTMTLLDGDESYDNATFGSLMTPVFTSAEQRFDIPLNASTILSLFSLNDLSCAVQNQLVDFNSTATPNQKARRFIMLPDFSLSPTATPTLHPRQVSSSNGIVFAASSTAEAAPEATSPSTTSPDSDSDSDPDSVSTVTSLSPTSTSTPTSFTPLNIPSDQLSFASVVVLYVFEQSRAVSVAVNAQQNIQTFFAGGGTADQSSSIVSVGFGELRIEADFEALEIRDDGEVVGGT